MKSAKLQLFNGVSLGGKYKSMIMIRLNSNSKEPLYEQLYKYIKTEIIGGGFPYHTKLPSKRLLAAYLQCSQNTVQNAYNQLIAEGYIMSKPKSGFYVCKLDGVINIKKETLYCTENDKSKPIYPYDFSHHGVDMENFPFSTWRKITKEVINEYDPDLLRLGNSQGDFNLRSCISDYLRHSRGVKCSPHQIIISSGTEFLLQLLIQLFPSNYVFGLENPGYEKLNLIFKSNHAPYKAISLDQDGMVPDEVVKNGADVICITPSHQFPTGNIMPINRRLQLLTWANEKAERYVIEDDYDSEFKYSGKPIPSLQGLDTGGKIIYMGAFSKSLTPAIRVSYMVLPEQLLKVYYEKLNFYICPVPTIEQKSLYRFINEGHFERHLNKMRNIYKKKRDTLVSAIRRLLPYVEISGANAGLHLPLKVKTKMSESSLIASAQNQGVNVYGFSQFFLGHCPQKGYCELLLGFASLKESEILKGVELLSQAWH
jgi:GntR family transcriptional regulator/MocR family aminotransferase